MKLFLSVIVFLMGVSLDAVFADNFVFNPTPWKTFKVTSVIIRERDMGTLGSQSTEMDSVVNVTVKPTKEGWIFSFLPESVVLKQDGKVTQNPFMESLQKLPFEYVVNRQGELVKVNGFDKALALLSSVPVAYQEHMKALLNEEVLIEKEKIEWQGRVGDFVGKSFSFKDSWKQALPITLPNGISLHYDLETSFAPSKKQRGYVEITQSYEGQSGNISDKIGDLGGVTAQGPTYFSGRGVRVMDPKTMKLLSEDYKRTITMSMEVPGLGARDVKMIETRTYTFSY